MRAFRVIASVLGLLALAVLALRPWEATAQPPFGYMRLLDGAHNQAARIDHAGALSVFGSLSVAHISSVVHFSAAGTPWGANMALATRCVNTAGSAFEACGGAGGPTDNIQHISGALHVAGTISGAAFHVQGLGTPGQSHGGVLSIQGVGGGNPLAATQSGVWTVQPGNTANTTSWLTSITHVTSVVHVAASGLGTPQQALSVRCVNTGATAFEACGGAGGGADAVNVFHQSTIRHISSVTHVVGYAGAALHVQGLGTPGQSHGGVLSIQGIGGGNPLAATQSGTWTVQPGNTANTTAWLVTGTGGTFPVTGTVTTTQGTAGAAAWPVIASQGSAGNFKWPVDAHIATGAVSQGTAGNFKWPVDAHIATGSVGQGTAGNFLWPVSAHIQTGAVQQGAAGAQVWPVAAHQATQAGGVWRIDHITSATHVVTGSTAPLHIVASTGSGNLVCHSQTEIHQTATGGIVAHGVTGLRVFICSVVLVAETAQNVSIVEGTGLHCGASMRGVVGAVHASIALAANGGFSSVSPFPWVATQVAGNQLCLRKSLSTGAVSGVVTYRGGP